MQFESWEQPQPEWSAFRASNGFVPKNRTEVNIGLFADGSDEVGEDYDYQDTYGFGLARFYNSSHMYYENIPVHGSIGNDGFWIIKRL